MQQHVHVGNSLDNLKLSLDLEIYAQCRGIVQGGPFKGMQLLKEVNWGGSRLAPMVFGCYEEELHGELEREIKLLGELETPRIAVVGCAEGYYAVGLKLRIPQATVFAVDSDDKTLSLCKTAAALNGIDLVYNPDVNEYLNSDFILMDVEGSERAYLDPDRFPSLANSHVIVELHDFKDITPNTTNTLLQRFRGSHRINLIMEGPRNPNMYPCLFSYHSDLRWLAISEGRPCLMSWFVMYPRGASVT
jgi:hypothetical protein